MKIITEGRKLDAQLTTEHAASSYGRPVLVTEDGQAWGGADLRLQTAEIVATGPEELAALQAAGYEARLGVETAGRFAARSWWAAVAAEHRVELTGEPAPDDWRWLETEALGRPATTEEQRSFAAAFAAELENLRQAVTPAGLRRWLLETYQTGERCFRDEALAGADLSGANMRGVDFRGADLSGANMRGVDFRGSDLSGANMRGAKLREANFAAAKLRGVDLRNADLTGARFAGADLRDARLTGADLWNTDFEGADLENADLRGTDHERAKFEGADLSGAKLGEHGQRFDVRTTAGRWAEAGTLERAEELYREALDRVGGPAWVLDRETDQVVIGEAPRQI